MNEPAAEKQTPPPDEFPVTELPDECPEQAEQAGLTTKFWLHQKQLLYKQAREKTGEHWSEKFASELAQMLGLPFARVELACWRDQPGVVTHSFLEDDEVFIEAFKLRPLIHVSKDQEHLTLEQTLRLLQVIEPPLRWTPPRESSTSAATFIGYLIFDAWIANEDRHDRNWGVVARNGQKRYFLAPTFDHASSLGREISDEQRTVMMATGQVQDYTRSCPAGVNANASTLPAKRSGRLTTAHGILDQIVKSHRKEARFWLDRVVATDIAVVEKILNRIPPRWLTPLSKAFALELLAYNHHCLKSLLARIK